MKAPASSKIVRGTIGALALGRAGVAHWRHQAKQDFSAQTQDEHEAELGRILFRALNQLKGTALKLGQMLSLEAGFLPEGVRLELSKTCYQATPVNRALVHKLFRAELGQAPEHLFAKFDANAHAAASLGQVHLAQCHDGHKLAVKIQYPGIAASIQSDIAMLGLVLKNFARHSTLLPRQEVIDHVLQEVSQKLTEELDYQHEAEQLTWFADRVVNPNILIPHVFTHLSSRRVLSMQRIEGLHLQAWLANNPSQAERNHFGQLLFDWFWTCVSDLGRLHADPHAGNFLFVLSENSCHENPFGKLAVLDFGCTKTLSPEFCASMKQCWQAWRSSPPDSASLYRVYVDLGFIEVDFDFNVFSDQLQAAIEPLYIWQLEPYQTDRFDFKQKSAFPHAQLRDNELAQKMSKFNTELPYFGRAYMGLMQMLHQMEAVVNTKNPFL
ncbi:ABC1 kinase family protein [Undibacterium sp.]|uniref:ABC1 kinase family protein n=1 Tax=Undibacterium sp. TaxID=1914977 RepID=UPI003750E90D